MSSLVDRIAERFVLEGEKIRDQVRAGLKETRDSLRITAARYATLYPNSLHATSPGRLVGWSIRETSGAAPATVTIYDGREATANILAVVNLLAGVSSTIGLPGSGVSFGDGLYVAGTGAVAGALYFGAVD